MQPIPVVIENARGIDVYPGPDAIGCPALLGPPLAAHATMSTTGNWDQTGGGLRPARIATLVPAGRYRIVIAGKVALPLTLTRNSTPSAGFTSTLRSTP